MSEKRGMYDGLNKFVPSQQLHCCPAIGWMAHGNSPRPVSSSKGGTVLRKDTCRCQKGPDITWGQPGGQFHVHNMCQPARNSAWRPAGHLVRSADRGELVETCRALAQKLRAACSSMHLCPSRGPLRAQRTCGHLPMHSADAHLLILQLLGDVPVGGAGDFEACGQRRAGCMGGLGGLAGGQVGGRVGGGVRG